MRAKWLGLLAILCLSLQFSFAWADSDADPCSEVLVSDWQPPQGPTKTLEVDPDLVVTSEWNDYTLETQVFRFRGGVVATYGTTTVRADSLTVDRANQTADAVGHVVLDDPDGGLIADRLQFTWKLNNRTGRAENVTAKIATVTIRARLAVIKDGQYDLYDVAGSSCGSRRPFYQLRTRHLTINPARNGRAERPQVYVLGRHLVTLPTRNFSLDRRTEGITLPSISARRDVGVGVTWGGGFLLNSTTNFAFNVGAYNGVRPGYGATVSHSFLPADDITDVVTPKSEFSERFRFGYLDNVKIVSSGSEQNFFQRVRSSASLSSLWNQGVVGRDRDTSFSKPVELTYETSGPIGSGGYWGQIRGQTIKRAQDSLVGRVVLLGSRIYPTATIARNTTSMLRVDSNIYGDDLGYGWFRGMAGVSYRPWRSVTLSGGVYSSFDLGTPRYKTDKLFSKEGGMLRFDFDFGTTVFSLLNKWDPDLGNYDMEYSFSQVVGCFEPFMIYRKNPSEYQVGLRLRLAPFYAALRRKDFHAGNTPRVISGPNDSAPKTK